MRKLFLALMVFSSAPVLAFDEAKFVTALWAKGAKFGQTPPEVPIRAVSKLSCADPYTGGDTATEGHIVDVGGQRAYLVFNSGILVGFNSLQYGFDCYPRVEWSVQREGVDYPLPRSTAESQSLADCTKLTKAAVKAAGKQCIPGTAI